MIVEHKISYDHRMPTIDLTDDEHAALTAAARKVSDEDRYSLSARLKPLKSALAKLDPAHALQSTPEPRPPLPEAPTRSRGGRRARR